MLERLTLMRRILFTASVRLFFRGVCWRPWQRNICLKKNDLWARPTRAKLLPEEPVMVRRARLLDDTSSLYGGIDMPSIVSSGLKVSFRGEMEEDAGGVTRDLFTSYWRGMLAEWFSGKATRVPCVPASRIGEGDAALLAAGRVLTHGLILTQSLPPQLSRVHFLTAYDGILLEDLLPYVTPSDAAALLQGLESEGEFAEDLARVIFLYFWQISTVGEAYPG